VLKPLWAPVLDGVHPPGFASHLGRRRGWLALAAMIEALAQVGLGLAITAPLAIIALLALILTFASATQDMAIDALRIEQVEGSRQATALAFYVAGYRLALVAATAGAVPLASMLTGDGWPIETAQGVAALGLAVIGILSTLAVLMVTEPTPVDQGTITAPLVDRLRHAVMEPLRDLFARRGGLVLLIFVALFKLGDAVAGTMLAPFVLSAGFSAELYATLVPQAGVVALILGGFLGGFISRRFGLGAGLWIAGIAQALSTAAFPLLLIPGAGTGMLAALIALEYGTNGLGGVIFAAFLSACCRHRGATATEFALLSALASAGRSVVAGGAGFAAEAVGWPAFFALAAILALPGLVTLWFVTMPQEEKADDGTAAGRSG